MRYSFIVIMGLALLASCVTDKKAWNRVARDPVIDAQEMEIMANKCKSLFPETKTAPVQAGSGVDSAAYKTAIENQNILLDQIIEAQEIIDSLTGRPPATVTPGDSARIIRNYIFKQKPIPIYIHDTTEVEVESLSAKATIGQQQQTIIGLRAENAQAIADKGKAEQVANDKRKTNTWLWVVMALAIAGNILQISNRFR